MQVFFLAFFMLFVSSASLAQTYEYLGVIKLNDTALIPYRLAFTESNGEISGYSLSDLGGKHETKSNIRGIYNNKEKKLTFQEYDIVYTKSPIDELDMCLVNFEGTLKNLSKNKAFSGDFIGLYPDGKNCLDGMIIVSNAQKVEERIAKFDKKIQKSKKVSQEVKNKISLKRSIDTLTMSTVKATENLNIFVKNREATLVIYDAGKVDDDRVQITINGAVILNDYSILQEKKRIPVTLVNGTSKIEVLAINEGTSAPNTVKVEILDGDNLITTRTSLKTGQKASLTLIKE
jgi:hypothetical protein